MLSLSKRTEAILTKAGFDSLESVAEYAFKNGIRTLTETKGIGEKTINEIVKALEGAGLRYRPSGEERIFLFFSRYRDFPHSVSSLVPATYQELREYFFYHPLNSEQKKMFNEKILAAIEERPRMILEKSYGLNGEKPMGLKEIAKEFGVTIERAMLLRAEGLRSAYCIYWKQGGAGLAMFMTREDLGNKILEAERVLEEYQRHFGTLELGDTTPIERLELSTRAYGCLLRAGIDTVEKVKKADLDKVRNLGLISKREVVEKLEKFKNAAC